MSLPNGTYHLINVGANLPLTPSSDAPNSTIIANTDDSSDSFKWVLTNVSGNIYTISNVKNKMFAWLGVNIVDPPANVVVATVSQQFVINPVAGSPGVYTVQTVDTSVFWSLNSATPGSNVGVSKTGTAALQQFRIVDLTQDLETGTYKLTNVATQLPLKPQSNAQGSSIIATTDDYTDNFKWVLNKIAKDLYTIRSTGANMNAYGGNNIQANTSILLDTSSQTYRIQRVPGTADAYSIATIDSGVFWGLRSAVPGSNVITGNTNTAQTYQWFIRKP